MEKNNGNRSDFTWESFYTVSNEKKYDLIRRIRRMGGAEEEGIIDELRAEWNALQAEGDDPALDEKFENEIAKFEERFGLLSESISGKKALIAQAKELKDSNDFFKTSERLKELQTKWREFGYSGKELNDQLWEEFSEINDYFFNRRKEFYDDQNKLREEARVAKEALIERAEALKDSTDWRATSTAQRDLMEEWKEAGFASREAENELWNRFNEARQVFYKAQEEHFNIVREQETGAREIKEKLIAETNDLKESHDFDTVRSRFDQMMEEWKEAGHSGRRHEEKLWQQFREGRDYFYSRLTNANAQSREERRENAFNAIDDTNHRIDTLEEMNDMIQAKIQQLENRPDQSEETDKELAETRSYFDENEKTLNDLYDQLKRLNDELDRL